MVRVSHNLEFNHVTTSAKQESSTWGNRLIVLLSKVFHAIYHQIFDRLSKFVYLVPPPKEEKKSYHHTTQTPFSVNFTKGEPKVEVDLKQQIEAAEKEFISNEKGLLYILRFRMKETISHSRQMFKQLNEVIPKKHVDSLAVETEKLMTYLKEEEVKLAEEMSKEEVNRHIQHLFAHIHAYYKLQRNIGVQLPAGSSEKNKFNKAAKELFTEVQRQQKKYQTPSSDPYLHSLQYNCKQALQELENLKSRLSIPTI